MGAHLSLAALNGAGGLVQAAGQAVVGQSLLHHHLRAATWNDRWSLDLLALPRALHGPHALLSAAPNAARACCPLLHSAPPPHLDGGVEVHGLAGGGGRRGLLHRLRALPSAAGSGGGSKRQSEEPASGGSGRAAAAQVLPAHFCRVQSDAACVLLLARGLGAARSCGRARTRQTLLVLDR